MMKCVLVVSLMLGCGVLFGQEGVKKGEIDTEVLRKAEQGGDADVHGDPFAEDALAARPGQWRERAEVRTLQVRLEWYEVDAMGVIRLLDGWAPAKDAGDFRKQVMGMEGCEVFETSLLQVDVGELSEAEAIKEAIYPTEYAPEGLDAKDDDVEEMEGRVFETRNIGAAVKVAVEPVEGGEFDVRVSPEFVSEHGVVKFGEKGVEMPVFTTTRLSLTARVGSGEWRLVSVQPAVDEETGGVLKGRRLVVFLRVDEL